MKKLFIAACSTLLIFGSFDAEACNFFKKITDNIEIKQTQNVASPINEREKIQEDLDKLFDSYNSRRLSSFMRRTSEDFAEDEDVLEDSLRKDFLKYSYIDTNYFINSIIPDDNGKYAVTLSFTRKLEDRKTGTIKSDSGFATIILIKTNNRFKLYSQRRPFLFGNN